MQERFSQTGTSGDTTRKALSFFMKAAKDAGIELSPHIVKGPGPRPGTSRRRRKPSQPQSSQGITNNINEDFSYKEGISLEKLLLSKFPSFDPAWSDEIKAKWFDGFKELMAQFKNQSQEE